MNDSAARLEAQQNFRKTILVEAGAGTGKTTLLVNRICSMIEAGIHPERIAAVTFTVKAAGEMKQRLRNQLRKSESKHAREALENLDRMTINTIHGMAAEFLRMLPVEAKLPPEFTSLDELQQQVAMKDFRESWLTRALDLDVPASFAFADLLGLNLLGNDTKSLSSLFDRLVLSMLDPDELSTGADSVEEVVQAVAPLEHAVANLAPMIQHCSNPDDKLLRQIESALNWYNTRPAEIWSDQGVLWLSAGDAASKQKGSKSNWAVGTLDEARSRYADFTQSVRNLRNTAMSVVCSDCKRWLAPAVLQFRESLRSRGMIGFDDQLLLCRNMLRDSKIARDFFKSRFDHVHIDEFQDTDPVQAEILFYICESKLTHVTRWQDIELEPGKLFVVGDPKQSIYRFRGADVRIYNKVASEIEKEGNKLTITKNFRSFKGILSEVNEITRPLMSARNEYESDYVDLVPSDEASDDDRAVELLVPPATYDRLSQNAALAAKWEAAVIAEHINTLAQNTPGFCFSQVAILMRSGTHISRLQEALGARDIPFISFINEAYVGRVEIESVLTMLLAISNPQHTVAVIGALRSVWYALSDDQLFEHKLSGGSFVYTDNLPRTGPVGAALDSLLSWHRKSKHMSPSALIEELLAVTHTELIFGLKSEGTQRVQNIQTLVEYVRRFEQIGTPSLSSIVERISSMTKLVQNTELDAHDDERRAVQIMSLHKAKGLEFDHVYIFRYDESKQNDGDWTVLKNINDTGHEIGISANNGGYCTLNWETISGQEVLAHTAELNRLLYVGMTRARRKLILPLAWQRTSHKSSKPKIPEPLLARYPLDKDNLPCVDNTLAARTSSNAVLLRDYRPLASRLKWNADVSDRGIAEYAEWQASLESRVNSLRPAFVRTEEEDTAVDWRQVRARKIGIYVHAVLEQIAKGRKLDHARTLVQRGSKLNPSELEEADRIIENVTASSLFTVDLPQAKTVITELPIVAVADGTPVSKFVDLIFETASGEWVLLDYKSDDIPAEAVGVRTEYHREQIDTYAALFEKLFGRSPARKHLYFLRPDVLVDLK